MVAKYRREVKILFLLLMLALFCSSHSLALAAQVKPQKFIYPAIKTKLSTDTSAAFLKGNAQGGQIARTAPTIDFERFEIDAKKYGTEYGTWGNAVLGPDGKYYFGFGDHSTKDGGQNGAILGSYDPKTQKSEMLLFSKDLFGPTGEGKWHGRPDINPATGDMYLVGFYNGHVVHYNIYSREVEDLGAPVANTGWPEHTWDWKRDRLYGVGDGKGSILVYDTKNRKLIHSGLPVDAKTGKAFSWDSRARLLDRDTGNLYSTDMTNHMAKYNPATNTFTLMKSTLRSHLRAWTNQKEADGSFWIFDDKGNIYRFYPEQDRVVYKGKNWGNTGWYSASLERSPDGKYLYYALADKGNTQGEPILQYNTVTNKVKVIAFLSSFYTKTYKFDTNKIYGVALSKDGSSLFAVSNGNTINGPRMPTLFNVHIPASER